MFITFKYERGGFRQSVTLEDMHASLPVQASAMHVALQAARLRFKAQDRNMKSKRERQLQVTAGDGAQGEFFFTVLYLI